MRKDLTSTIRSWELWKTMFQITVTLEFSSKIPVGIVFMKVILINSKDCGIAGNLIVGNDYGIYYIILRILTWKINLQDLIIYL